MSKPIRSARWPRCWLGTAILLGSLWIIGSTTSAIAQTRPTPPVSLPWQSIPWTQLERWVSQGAPTFETGTVRLDGLRGFTIAAPIPAAIGQNAESERPITVRVRDIEEQLSQILAKLPQQNGFEVIQSSQPGSSERSNPQTLPVLSVQTAELSAKRLPPSYVMTVTRLDAELYGQNLQQTAQTLKGSITKLLERAYGERQPGFLRQQIYWASGLCLVMVMTSLELGVLQRRLRRSQQTPAVASEAATVTPAPNTPEATDQILQFRLQDRQQRNSLKLKRFLLQTGQVAIWVGGTLAILGLFHQTRWLQLLILRSLRVPLRILAVSLGSYLGVRLSFVFIDRFFTVLQGPDLLIPERSQRWALRASTFSRVARSGATFVWFSVACFAILAILGVDLVPLLAGAGVLGLAISFASQSIIKDTINGFLILLEDQYGVGDIIQIGTAVGLVESMNLRITQLRSSEGRLITIPNSEIRVVENLTKDWSRVDLAVEINEAADPNVAIALVKETAQDLYTDPGWQSKILEAPEVLGIDRLHHEGVMIRTWVKTLPSEQWSVARELRRRLKVRLNGAGLALGIPQQTVRIFNQPSGDPFSPSS